MADAVAYISELEPWEQVDACVFPREREWVLNFAVTILSPLKRTWEIRMKNFDNKKKKGWRRLPLGLCFLATACGTKADTDIKTEMGETAGTSREADSPAAQKDVADAADTGSRQGGTDIIMVYTTEKLEDSEEEIPALYTDDLSLLDHMEQEGSGYAYRDGMVYYRQYHIDSFEDGALWADYAPTAGTDKEIVCIDADGKQTVLFSDQGYGSICLVGERFYMTEAVMKQSESGERVYSNIYSVDMQGQNRMEHGFGEIYAVDVDRGILILKQQPENTWKGTYAALDCGSGEIVPLAFDACEYQTFWDYHDGWCYFDVHKEGESGICRVAAISLDGEQKEILALTSNNETEETPGYTEEICQIGTDGDRIYIVYGGYAGTGHFYQGGRIITTKLDGSDYRAMECEADSFYVCHDGGRTLVYVPRLVYVPDNESGYEATVWDVEENRVFPSDFPQRLIWGQKRHEEMPYREYMPPRPLCIVGDEERNFYALPDDSGKIVPVAMGVEKKVAMRGGGEVDYIDYKNFYYADGFLYFDVEFNIYNAEYAIGWRDGYDRLQTDVYRLNLETDAIELLYSY